MHILNDILTCYLEKYIKQIVNQEEEATFRETGIIKEVMRM